MNGNDIDESLVEVFAGQPQVESSAAFTADVIRGTRRLDRRRMLRRILVGLLCTLLLPPVQEFGLALTEVLMISLVEVEGSLIAEILAPVNSVAAVLSMVLFGIRLLHRRVFIG